MSLRHYPDFKTYVSLGKINNVSALFKFGLNPDIDTGTTPEDIWGIAGEYVFPSAAGQITLSSTAAEDIRGGLGANSVIITGLNSAFEIISEEIDLNSNTEVTTTQSFLRVNGAVVGDAGSHGANAGDITGSIGLGNVFRITQDDGEALQAIYTVPKDHSLAIEKIFANIQKVATGFATYVLQTREEGRSWVTRQNIEANAAGSGAIERNGFTPFAVHEKTDIRIRCTEVSTNDVQAVASFDGTLFNNLEFGF